MSNTVTLGGDRLGSGKKQKVELRTYSRSNHDLSYVWRSTMASGTLVPFMNEVALPADDFEIDLECDVKTHPTIGPLFGSYKVQLDVFEVPVRLYHGKLHMNMLNIGLKMSQIKLPLLQVYTGEGIDNLNDDNAHVNPSCILSYLGIRGVGRQNLAPPTQAYMVREFNAVPYLAYWDIYKNYYANKQEEIGVVIHNSMQTTSNALVEMFMTVGGIQREIDSTTKSSPIITMNTDDYAYAIMNNNEIPQTKQLRLIIDNQEYAIDDLYEYSEFNELTQEWKFTKPTSFFFSIIPSSTLYYRYSDQIKPVTDSKPKLETFPLANIDYMREYLLKNVEQASAININNQELATLTPYCNIVKGTDDPDTGFIRRSITSNQEGLGIKTYQSDLFNNWISTEWIDGEDGISALTSIDTTGGSFTIDSLNIANKVYNMLNGIAMSGGSYDDWLNAVYMHERTRSSENPIYQGGLIKELVFQEVISNAEANDQPLGTLAGRGVLSHKHKGGKIVIKTNEPSVLIGIVSITPRIDYSQGNKWSTNIKTMDDFHKPALDQIGFQDLITDQMAWFDTEVLDNSELVFKSAGKQPAWINYMTNVNEVRGNFADKNQQMFMVLNRRFERDANGIKDLTTYVDPSKFNHIFADTRLDAQNFWVQIGANIKVRRKMSAKIIPNL